MNVQKKRKVFHLELLVLFLVFVIISDVDAISYRCENDQILIVQNFGNDTIRMHCQRLDLCGNGKLVGFFLNFFPICNLFKNCNYDYEQTTCGGKNNFVAHVNQASPTAT